jgi:aryl-alcohol dehydrogenase-like predicted oxidoreductase
LNYMVGPDSMRLRWQEARLDELLDGMSRTEFTLRFTLSHPALTSVLVGTKNPAHLRENVEIAAKGPLPNDVLSEAKRRLDAIGAGSQSAFP